MADQTVVHIGENSPEEVALKLFRTVAAVEGKKLEPTAGVDRKWILDTYAECLNAVRFPDRRTSSSSPARSRSSLTPPPAPI